MSEYLATYNEIIDRLRTTRRKETLFLFASGVLKTLAVTAGLILLVTLIETFAHGDEIFRTILAAMVFVGTVVAAGIFLMPSILRGTINKYAPTEEIMALRIGSAYPDLRDNLCNTIQLVSNLKVSSGTSPELALAAFQDVSSVARSKDFDVIIDKNEVKRSILFFLFAVLITFGSIGIFSSSLGSAFYRVMNWNQSFLPPAPFSLSIQPKSASILRGQAITITVKATGTVPETVNLYIKEDQQENYDVYSLKSDTAGVFVYNIPSLKRSITFYAASPWLNSEVTTTEGRISVTDKPSIRSLTGRVVYPGYAGLAPKNFDEQTADISALRGSRVELQVMSNKEISQAFIMFEKAASPLASTEKAVPTMDKIQALSVPMKVEDRRAVGGFTVTENGSYYVVLKDKDGQQNDDPIKYAVVALSDGYPSISLVDPTTDVQLSENALLPIKVAISDDYGFSALKLHYRLASSQYAPAQKDFATINLPMLSNGNALEVPYLWDLNKINISPEDKYEFYLEVFDNDRVSGPKSAKTQVLTLRLPSLDEVLKQADDTHDKIEKDLQTVLKQAESVRKDMEDLNNDLLKKQNQKEMDWKDKKQVEDMMKKQSDIQNKMAEIQKNLEEVTKQLQENKALSPETMQKYMELQKLMQEVNSPELKKLQEKMEQAMKNMSPEELQKAMKNFQFDEDQFKKSIDRTMKILKRLQAEQKADALQKRAEELMNKQQELQKQMENANPSDQQKRNELAKQQDDLQKDLNKINNDLRDLEQLMKEIGGNMPMNEMDKAKQELNADQTNKMMEEAQQAAQNGNFSRAKNNQQSASNNLKKFAEQMKNLKKQMEDRVSKEAMRKMQKAIDDMLKLSKEQEQLKQQTQSSDNNSTQFNDLAEQQSQLQEAMANVASSMMDLSEKSFSVTPEMGRQLGDALQKMQQSTQSLARRSSYNASKSQEQAMSSMNQAVMSMQSQLSQMQNPGNGSCDNPGGMGQPKSSGGAGNFMERLQQLAQQQQGINQSMQQQMGQGQQGGQLSQEQQAQIGRLASEQGKAQKSMQELAQEQKQYSGDGQRKGLGDLDKLAKEMQEVVTDMKNGQVTPETLKRQEKILSRLLDATRSMNERDFEKNRESTSGKDVLRKSPGAIDLSTQEGKTRAMQEMMRSIQQGYTKDYETLIRQYFESIQGNGNPPAKQ